MIKRVVEIGSPGMLSLSRRQLVFDRKDEDVVTVPLDDLGVLLLAHPAVCCTQALLSACWKANVAVVFCDERYMPGGLLLPMEGHSLHSRFLQAQIEASKPTMKRLWQSVIRAKIAEQANLIDEIGSDGYSIRHYCEKVQSGDPGNMEAQAARAYWPRLFGSDFRRDHDRPGTNTLLNYGYALLRSCTARAVVGAGMHPALGIHHRNQFNAFALADDLMEPLRPLVDRVVYRIWAENDELSLEANLKKEILSILAADVIGEEGQHSLVAALQLYAASVRDVLLGERQGPVIPRLIWAD